MLRTIVIAAFLTLFASGFASADGEKITELAIKGNRRIETIVILNAVKLKAGDTLALDRVDSDIRDIYKLGYFQDVKAETEKSDKGVVLIYRVVERPIVREVRIEGNKEIAADKVREAFDLKPGAIFSAKDLAKGVKKVKKLYADDGYYLAEVDASTVKRSDTDLRILLKITEGEKVLVKKIRFEGNRAFPDKKLKKGMETSEKWFLSWLTSGGAYKEEVLKNDIAGIADLYYNNGYVNVKVGEPKVELLPDKSGLIITIGITEGDQYRAGTVDFKGDLLESKEELAKKVKMKTGEVFSRGVLRGDIFALTDLYADKGYAFANVTPRSQVDQEKKTIGITFEFEKGDMVHIDRISISGNTKTRDKVVRREIKLAEGDLYNSTALKKSKQSLMNLGFFEEANITTAKGSAADKLNVNVEVKEKPTGTFSIGAGYSSLDGIVGQGSVQQANFLGLGLKANAAASLGGKSQTYNLGLTDPYFMDSKWTLGGDIYRTKRDFLDFSRRVTGGDIKGGYPLSDTLSTFWVYRFESKEIFNETQPLKDSIKNGLISQPETTSTTSSITGSITRNTTDYRLDPSSGMVNNLSMEFAGLGGTNRFLRSVGNTQVFYPFKWGTVFSVRGELGYIKGVGKEVPLDERFYLGGINTMRGYSGRTVSPYKVTSVATPGTSTLPQPLPIVNPTEPLLSLNRTAIGGDTEAILNTEWVFPLVKDAGLKGVLFFDFGDAYDGISTTFSRFQASYGFGFRWASPMGPLRLEYGIPVNPRDGIDSRSGKFEFSIGSFF
ncbi:MAG TPA: outer membrane protein assembly factor BamA [Geobacteraceae bacterium]